MLRKSGITVELAGGIGNQLFSYFAGAALALKDNSTLYLDPTYIRQGINQYQGSIELLSLPGIFLAKRRQKKSLYAFGRRLENFALRKSSIARWLDFKIRGRYTTNEIGFDRNLLDLKPQLYLRGYFQTWKYFKLVLEAKPSLRLEFLNTSDWYKEMSRRIISEAPISIHLRRGDYSPLSRTVGLLSNSYYISALKYLREHGNTNTVWIFSDDIELAQNFFQNEIFDGASYIEPPNGTDPLESLFLMRSAKAHIIANSTYSWWAAMLREHEGIVIAPDKWFRNMSDPLDLIPPQWVTITSSWED